MADRPGQRLAERPAPPAASLYERDFFAWTEEQARVLRNLRPAGVDWENAAEEIESVGRSSKTEIRNRLRVLMIHLLKWEHQPEKRKGGWLSTIGQQRSEIEGLLDDSPSLRSFPEEILPKIYDQARRLAAAETGLPLAAFPATFSHAVAQALDDRFMPGKPWAPDELGD